VESAEVVNKISSKECVMTQSTLSTHQCCSGHGAVCKQCPEYAISRRGFLAQAGGMASLAATYAPLNQVGENERGAVHAHPGRRPLCLQPVFVYASHERKEATSWRWTAEIYEKSAVEDERSRILQDLEAIKSQANFPIEIRPLVSIVNKDQAASVDPKGYDALLIYASARNPEVLEAVAQPGKWNLMFVRHRSGPIYYMYVGVHGHFFRKGRDSVSQTRMALNDVVVDSREDLLWRLRALTGLHNTLGKRIVCIGDPGGWGAEGELAPAQARERWKLEVLEVSYQDLGRRLKSVRADPAFLNRCRSTAAQYLERQGVRLETSRDFLEKSFILTEVFRNYLDEAKTDALTIGSCMYTVMEVSKTTACMPLSILNDEGYLALCEGDFVSIPTGMLLHYIAGTPVFMCNPSFPYNNEVTVSHCTAPSRMDGKTSEPVRILTHYESDFGAAPKVEMRLGQKLTVLDADFEDRRLMGFSGEIRNTPFYPMCRTQLEIGFKGDSSKLAKELRGWHWMVCYGDYLNEVGYAAGKAGLQWLRL
jgi:hypothetical protein